MGNLTTLSFGKSCAFEANNCIPVTWLALYEDKDFQFTEEVEEDSEEFRYTTATYKTTKQKALQRAEMAISQLKNLPVWALLKPIEILRDELIDCPIRAKIILNATPLYQHLGNAFDQSLQQAASNFQKTIHDFRGKEEDFSLLDVLINQYSLHSSSRPVPPFVALDPEEKMYKMIGLYWGDPDKEEKYSLSYFDNIYWKIS